MEGPTAFTISGPFLALTLGPFFKRLFLPLAFCPDLLERPPGVELFHARVSSDLAKEVAVGLSLLSILGRFIIPPVSLGL
jgi:hypothetical protein